MKILPVEAIRALDQHTIASEPISSIDLMERASLTFCQWFTEVFPPLEQQLLVFCGPGNNGGDGLAIARILHRKFYKVRVYTCEIGSSKSPDFLQNLERLPAFGAIVPSPINAGDAFPEITNNTIVIDAIFGSGLKRPVTGYWADLIAFINDSGQSIVSVDIPSGLFADRHSEGSCIRANYTFSFELPKLAFLLPENHPFTGEWIVRTIGLDKAFIDDYPSKWHYTDEEMIRRKLKNRSKYSHKGSFGHALLWMGSHGKVGASVLAAKACLRSGVGLLSVHAPACAYEILQTSIPEAMVSSDSHSYLLTEVPDLKPYRAIGLGCGMGVHRTSAEALEKLLAQTTVPLVIDADALNILGSHPELQKSIPPGSILTPHPGEFIRLFGPAGNDFERLQILQEQAQKLASVILLKGAHTCIAAPDGQCYFNSTGNPGMATAGSGDVLTGIITGLLTQGYSPLDSAILGAYLHGLAGDLAVHKIGQEALIASDIINHLGQTFQQLQKTNQP